MFDEVASEDVPVTDAVKVTSSPPEGVDNEEVQPFSPHFVSLSGTGGPDAVSGDVS